jgi:predicted amidophosphoribosyltransferase
MKVVPPRTARTRVGNEHHVCNMCGKPAEVPICDECAERLRIETLSRKEARRARRRVVAL